MKKTIYPIAKIMFIMIMVLAFNQSLIAQSSCYHAGNLGSYNAGGDAVNGLAVDPSGNSYVTGYFNAVSEFVLYGSSSYTLSAGTYTTAYVAKYDASFNLIWVKKFGGTNNTYGNSIILDASGNIYFTGFGSGDFDPGAGVLNLSGGFICKLDNSGNLVWGKSIGAQTLCSSIKLDGSGNVWTTGVFVGTCDFDPGAGIVNMTSAGSSDAFVSKLDPSGAYMNSVRFGGTGTESSNSISLDGLGNVFIGGSFQNTVNFAPGLYASNGGKDAFVTKLTNSATAVWTKRIGGSIDEEVNSIDIDRSGNVLMTGYFYFSVDFDPGPGTYSLTSFSGKTVFETKLDNNGSFVWANQYTGGSGDAGNSITTDANRNVYVTGYYKTSGSYAEEVFIDRLDSAGNSIWSKQLTSYNYDAGRAIAVDANKNIYVAGIMGNGFYVDFDPFNPIYLIGHGYDDGFLIKFPSLVISTPVQTAYIQCGGASTGAASVAVVDGSPPFTYTWGPASGTVPSSNTISVTNFSAGIWNITVADVNGCKTGTNINISQPPPITLTVNKTDESCVGGFNNGSATVTASGGTWFYTSYLWSSSSTATNSSVNGLSAGIYTITVVDGYSCVATSTVNVSTVTNPSAFSYTVNGMVATFSVTGPTCSTFLWDFGNGVTSSINPNPTITYVNSGIVSVCLQCNGQPASCVNCVNLTIPSNSVGAIGVQEYKNENVVSVYPNPFETLTTVQIDNVNNYEKCEIRIFDVLGKEVQKINVINEKTIIKKGEMKEGVYFYRIESKDQLISSGKLIIN